MKNVEIKCDDCGVDLTTTTNCEDFLIKVSSERIRSCGGAVTLMAVYPHLEKDMHFCGWGCFQRRFDKFLKKES